MGTFVNSFDEAILPDFLPNDVSALWVTENQADEADDQVMSQCIPEEGSSVRPVVISVQHGMVARGTVLPPECSMNPMKLLALTAVASLLVLPLGWPDREFLTFPRIAA